MIPALRWAAMRAILMCHNFSKSQDSVQKTTTCFEEKGEPKRYRTEVLPLTNLFALPLGQTGSLPLFCFITAFIPND